MDQRTLLGRLLSPAGFGLALLFFLLPFVTVSCGAEQPIESTFTGMDLVVGGAPDMKGEIVDAEVEQEFAAIFADELDIDVMALLAAFAVMGGMATALIREQLARHAVGAGLAVLAGALLTGAVLRAPGRAETALSDFGDSSELLEPVSPTTTIAFGFWLTVALLTVIAAVHIVMLARAWNGTPAPPHPVPLNADD